MLSRRTKKSTRNHASSEEWAECNMSIPINTIIKVGAHILLPDVVDAINVFWFLIDDNVGSGPLDEDDIITATENWLDLLYAEVLASLADTVSGELVDVWEVEEGPFNLKPIGDGLQSWAGSAPQDAAPNGVAQVAALKTVNTDVTGRKFIPGSAETSMTDNNLTGTALARLLDFGIYWAAQYIDANDVILNPGVYSKTKSNFYASTGTIVGNAIVGYQRRRKPGVGT